MNETEPLHVLLVDDDMFLVDMYTKKFKAEGYAITVSLRADEALSKLRQGLEPDIILLDIIMPEMSGLEFLSAIRDERLAEDAAVIMLTNEGGSKSIADAQKYGADGYIVKVTSIPSEIIERVNRIYEESREAPGEMGVPS